MNALAVSRNYRHSLLNSLSFSRQRFALIKNVAECRTYVIAKNPNPSDVGILSLLSTRGGHVVALNLRNSSNNSLWLLSSRSFSQTAHLRQTGDGNKQNNSNGNKPDDGTLNLP
jgi:hypothetical protein